MIGILFAVILLPLVAIVPFDQTATLWLMQYEQSQFAGVMKRSFFEGAALGISDLGVLFWIFCLVYYALALRLPHLISEQRRIEISYILIVGVFFGVGIVHPLKLISGRPRPNMVLSGLPYNGWYEHGVLHPIHGWFSGSFPSGHVATLMNFFAWGYLYWRSNKSKQQTLGVFILASSAIAGCFMTIARSMSGDHWLSDGWASLGLGALSCIFCFERLGVETRLVQAATPGSTNQGRAIDRFSADGFGKLLRWLGAVLLLSLLLLGLRGLLLILMH